MNGQIRHDFDTQYPEKKYRDTETEKNVLETRFAKTDPRRIHRRRCETDEGDDGKRDRHYCPGSKSMSVSDSGGPGSGSTACPNICIVTSTIENRATAATATAD